MRFTHRALGVLLTAVSALVRAELPTHTASGEPYPPWKVDMKVDNLRLDRLLHAQSRIESRNQIISHYVSGRVTMDVRDYPLVQMEDDVLTQRGYARVGVPGTTMSIVSKPCALSLWRNARVSVPAGSDNLLDKRLGVDLDAKNLNLINVVLAEFLFGPTQSSAGSPETAALASRVVSVRTRDVPVRDILQSIAVATGFDIEVDVGAKTLRYTALQQPSADCEAEAKLEVKTPPLPQSKWRLAPLEYFAMADIRLVGWMRYNGMRSKPVALAAVDNALYPVQIGTFLGPDFGVVLDIEYDGVLIKEEGPLDPAAPDQWMMRRLLLPYVRMPDGD